MVKIKVLILGGTGFIGTQLIQELLAKGHQVVLLTRNKTNAKKVFNERVELVEWDYSYIILPAKELENIDVVINLAGESIGSGRWTKARKELILNSRIKTTKAIIEAINDGILQPKVLLNASAVGYYGPRGDEEVSEDGLPGQDFLANVTKSWEAEANKAKDSGVRVVTLRIGLVLGEDGALKQMLMPYKLYVGGSLGSGEQWISWIHVKDLVRLMWYAIENEAISGPINGTAPNPVKMKDFSKIVGSVMKKPAWFTVPGGLLRLVLGEMADMLLTGQRVIPKIISNTGFKFKYTKLNKALEDILEEKENT